MIREERMVKIINIILLYPIKKVTTFPISRNLG